MKGDTRALLVGVVVQVLPGHQHDERVGRLLVIEKLLWQLRQQVSQLGGGDFAAVGAQVQLMARAAITVSIGLQSERMAGHIEELLFNVGQHRGLEQCVQVNRRMAR